MKNAVIEAFGSYDPRHYSVPWVCRMNPDGTHDFSSRVGTYTGRNGSDGELVVTDPVEGQAYGYGQKDYRGGNTVVKHAIWDGHAFVPCDKLGRFLREPAMAR